MPSERWYQDVAAELDRLKQRVDKIPDRLGEGRGALQVRLAITVPDPYDGTYPAYQQSPNTYWIVFVDGTYTAQVDGLLNHQLTARQNLDEARVTAHNIVAGQCGYAAVYTLVLAVFQNERWWFFHVCGCGGTCDSGSSLSSTSEPSSGSSSGSSSGDSSSGDSSSGSSSDGGSSSDDSSGGDSSSGSSSDGGSSGPQCADASAFGLDDVPYGSDPDYVLGMKNGCLIWVPVERCQ